MRACCRIEIPLQSCPCLPLKMLCEKKVQWEYRQQKYAISHTYWKIFTTCLMPHVRNPIQGEWHEAQILQNIFSK